VSELVEPLRALVVWLMDVTSVPVLVYFVLINTSYLLLIVLGGLEFRGYLRGRKTTVDTLGGELTPGVSLLVPAYNEEAGIVTSSRRSTSSRCPVTCPRTCPCARGCERSTCHATGARGSSSRPRRTPAAPRR
jgi:hypothetical protein